MSGVLSYPAHQDVDAVLRDGSTVHIRPIVAGDSEPLLRFLEGLSDQSRVFRFFTAVNDFEWVTQRFIEVDYRDRHGLVALRGSEGEIVGHGFYAKTAPGRAEIALTVSDSLQGMGLGTLLIEHLAQAASEAGIDTFEAQVMGENHRMLSVFRDVGFRLKARSGPGVIEVEFPTSLNEDALEHFEQREHTAAIAAVKRFFEPASIAVVGASSKRDSIGGEIFRNLLDSSFPGPVFPVSRSPVVQSVSAYPDVREIPAPLDLAVIAVPAPGVIDVARACGEKGVGALVVISAGFGETGEEGRSRQAGLLEVCREFGMRLIGPNCMGILTTDPARPFNATFAPASPPAGSVGFLSQSGALGLGVIDFARSLGLGLSSFVSVGNKADISGNDLIEYWSEDPRTGLILLYLESFGNPRRFSRIARRVSREKPILAVKSGRTGAGARATGSHTGALLAASDVTVDALFRQSGVIRTDTLAGLFDVAALLANQPAPRGPRVGILTNAGGPGILCADACVDAGLEVPLLSDGVSARLTGFLPPAAGVDNPVDMIASASADDFERAIEVVGTSGEVDALIVIFIPPIPTQAPAVGAAIRRAAGRLDGSRPVLASFISSQGFPPALEEEGIRIPSYAFPEEAARALGRVMDWTRWRDAEPARVPPALTGIREDEASGLIAAALAAGEGWVGVREASGLLECYGVPLAPWRMAADAREAVRAARTLGGRVAVKAVSASLLHKTEAGAVALDVSGDAAVRRAIAATAARVEAAGHHVEGFLVQAMAPPGVEMIIGVVQDAQFGPVIACGAGGTAVELVHDVAVRLPPLSEPDADEMLRSLATFPLLDGFRGAAPADLSALKEILLRVSALVVDHEEIAELDLNPVMAGPDGSLVVDVRVRLEARHRRPPEGARPRYGQAGSEEA